MEIFNCEMPRNYELVISSDLHLGSPCVCENSIGELVEYVATTKNCFHTNIGDNIEAILPNDKRFVFSDSKYKTPQQQADAVIELFNPIKKQTLAIGIGNHEFKLVNSFNIGKYIADELEVMNGSYCYKLQIYNKGNLAHKMFFTHGMGQVTSNAKDEIQAEGNKKAALKNKLSKASHGDVILMCMGHVHKSIIVEPTINNKLYLTTDKVGKIQQHYRYVEQQNGDFIPADAKWYVSNPSFMKSHAPVGSGYISYAEVAGYEPSEIGFTKVIVEDNMVQQVEFIRL